MPGAWTRLGPAKSKGLARSDQIGSVSTVTPSICTIIVACPIHVTVGTL